MHALESISIIVFTLGYNIIKAHQLLFAAKMPRCNLTLKQKIQIIDLSSNLSTEQIAKKFRVHPTTITRTLQKKKKFQEQASRVNGSFKTVQTFLKNEEHDVMVLEYIKSKQDLNEPLSIKEICDKAEEFAKALNRNLKSKRGWWRRFKVRCNIIRSKLSKNVIQQLQQQPQEQQDEQQPPELKQDSYEAQQEPQKKKRQTKAKEDGPANQKTTKKKVKRKTSAKNTKKDYTFKVKDTGLLSGNNIRQADQKNSNS